MSGSHIEGHVVYVKTSAADKRLHGYVGKIVSTDGPNVTLQLAISIGNQINKVTLPLADVKKCPS